MLVHRQIFLQYPSGLLQLQAFSLTVLPFLQDKQNNLSFQVRHLCFLVALTTRSPVPVASFWGRLPPVMCPLLACRRFQLLISPPPFCCGSGLPSRGSQDSRCHSLRGIYWISLALGRPHRTRTSVFTLVADQLVIRPTTRRKAMTDILSWMQAIAVYTLVVTGYNPARVTDLLKYQTTSCWSCAQPSKFPALLGSLTIAPFVGKPQLTNSLTGLTWTPNCFIFMSRATSLSKIP